MAHPHFMHRSRATKLIRILLVIMAFTYVFVLNTDAKAQERVGSTLGSIIRKKLNSGKLKIETSVKLSAGQKLAQIGPQNITCPYHGRDLATKESSGVLCLRDTPGMWFPWGVARLMLQDLVRGRSAINLLPTLEMQMAKKERTIFLLKEQAQSDQEISNRYKQLSIAQHNQLKSQYKWYKSKPFWFTVGVVTTIVVGITGAKIYQGLK